MGSPDKVEAEVTFEVTIPQPQPSTSTQPQPSTSTQPQPSTSTHPQPSTSKVPEVAEIQIYTKVKTNKEKC